MWHSCYICNLQFVIIQLMSVHLHRNTMNNLHYLLNENLNKASICNPSLPSTASHLSFSSPCPTYTRLLTLHSWPVCGYGSLSCHKLKNQHALDSRVPPALRSPLAADASWRVIGPLLCKSTNTLLLSLKTQAHTQTHTPPPKKIHRGYRSVREWGSFYSNKSLSLQHTPTHLYFTPMLSRPYHYVLHTPLTGNPPSSSGLSMSLLSPPPSRFNEISNFLYHHSFPEHQGHP